MEKANQISIPIEQIETLRKEIVEDCRLAMKEDTKNVFNGAECISVMMHLKRIADYASNICERVIYIQTGQIVELG
ncbi:MULTISPECIES: PhoU domain-containing protein [unclassified Streptococcus]|uniref:PhoU domain-containing protein n=1 Tax=unclassified Streptococcus TaxID=2608887 RepID=UPI00066FCCD1|nr:MULTISPECIES: PhoU domain-containing protein [unclassified Streptococcus]